MGTWSIPNTATAMTRLETLMESPVPASQASTMLSGLIGDDTLFDNIGYAEDRDPAADVRPLIAATLEEWSNWPTSVQWLSDWEDGCLKRASALAERYAGVDLSGLLDLRVPTADAAAACVAQVIDPMNSTHDSFIVRPVQGPGAYAVFNPERDQIFRVDAVWGLVQMPATMSDDIPAVQIFSDVRSSSPGPR